MFGDGRRRFPGASTGRSWRPVGDCGHRFFCRLEIGEDLFIGRETVLEEGTGCEEHVPARIRSAFVLAMGVDFHTMPITWQSRVARRSSIQPGKMERLYSEERLLSHLPRCIFFTPCVLSQAHSLAELASSFGNDSSGRVLEAQPMSVQLLAFESRLDSLLADHLIRPSPASLWTDITLSSTPCEILSIAVKEIRICLGRLVERGPNSSPW